MRTMVGDILQQAGFEIVGEAETGVQAVEKYKQLRPDLVTMDIVMPDMGGIDAVREITKFDPQARFLMCSAMGQQALVVEAIQAGAKDFVVKPFQPSRVLEAVQRVLGGARLTGCGAVDSSQYAELFLTESREHLSAINHWLLELEQVGGSGGSSADGSARAAEAVGAVFRSVHTVKGMSATMGYAVVAELSHELETVLDRMRRRELAVSPERMDLLFRAADLLEQAIETAVSGSEDRTVSGAVIEQLRASGKSDGQ